MTRIEIVVSEKRARLAKSVRYVCGNSDYVASFTFDEEWTDFPIKTARFQRGEQYTDVVFEGTDCPVPVFFDGTSMEIGVYSGTDAETAVLYSTTSAWVGMDKSVRSRSEQEMPDVYDQIIALLNDTADTTIGARDEVLQMAEEVSAAVETAAGYASEMQSSVDRAETAADLAEDARSEAQTAREDAILAKTETEALKTDVEIAQNTVESMKTEVTASVEEVETARREAVAAQSGAETARTYAEAAAESAESTLVSAMKSSVYDPQGYREDIYSYMDMRLGRKVYGVLWDKVNAKCTRRLWDAANITLDTTNFGHFGSVNPNYDNPFDSIYPWSERKLCNYSIAAFAEISDTDGYDVRDAVVAWEGEDGFSYDPAAGIGVGVYTPRFWHTSYDTDEGRVFAVSGTQVLGWNEAEPTIGGRWFGTVETMEIGGETKTVLGCRSGVPAGNIAMSTLHTYAKNGGMTIDDIYSYDATTVLAVVEYATMNSQNAIGNGCDSLYRQSSDKIMAAADNTNVVKVTKANASAYCIVGAIMDIGTGNGGRQIANRLITAVETDATDSTILNVTISGDPVSVTTDHYWSIHGIGNIADAEVGSRSGYIGTNGKCNAYYRGQVIHANLFRYVLGAYRQTGTGHIWIAKSRTQAEGYDTLDTTAHIDTGIVFQQGANGAVKEGYIKTLETTPGLSVPPFCDEVGGNSSNPVGDYCYVPALATGNTILLVGGRADYGALVGWLCGVWDRAAWYADWGISALPLSKSHKREV